MYKLTKDTDNGNKSKFVGIFSTKEKADKYARELSYVRCDLVMYRNTEHGSSTYLPYRYNIEEITIDPKVTINKSKALYIHGNYSLRSNGKADMLFEYAACDNIPKEYMRDYFREGEYDDNNYFFGFFLDVSELDNNISIEDYREYIYEKTLAFVTKEVKK